MNQVMFVVMISVLLIHEMDAVRTKEWKMFIILKDMPEESAYRVFTILHLPLYFAIILIMVNGGDCANSILYCAADIFLLGHTVIHYGFRNNKNNGFKSVFSRIVIGLLGILAVLHLIITI